ncbi:hypothetical protein KUV56_17570 [Ferrimonas balearica]|uniref:hypothetical protein n=1 Tax=Ferrimonas balearica TaxID=44012 RepID=UPI001C55B09D|nr:hypothetical protein [Ferrimonas balearica]MBW3141310.1 hypothetical protein [Ferrimonas balearica]MBY6108351.1 hypothetical protein [Ferrimonas balearica]
MDAFLQRWGWALVTTNLLGWGLALLGLYHYLFAATARASGLDPGLVMGLGVVLMLPQTLRLLLRYWFADDRAP